MLAGGGGEARLANRLEPLHPGDTLFMQSKGAAEPSPVRRQVIDLLPVEANMVSDPTPKGAPDDAQHRHGPIDSALRLRSQARAMAARRQELRDEHHSILRDLADLASRILRRRRYGDGSLDQR